MTVGQLKKKLEGLDSDIHIVTHGKDHSYNTVGFCGEINAEPYEGRLYEYYGSEHSAIRIKVFLVSGE